MILNIDGMDNWPNWVPSFMEIRKKRRFFPVDNVLLQEVSYGHLEHANVILNLLNYDYEIL